EEAAAQAIGPALRPGPTSRPSCWTAFTPRLRAENPLVTIRGHDDVRMTGVPKSLACAAVAAFLAAAPAALAAPPATSPSNKPPQTQTDPSNGNKGRGAQATNQGLVQSAPGIRALPNAARGRPVPPQTRILVDGRLATTADVKPGFVALVKWEGGKAAHQLAAFDLSAKSGERLATVEGVTKTSVSVTGASGGTTTIHVNVRTRV